MPYSTGNNQKSRFDSRYKKTTYADPSVEEEKMLFFSEKNKFFFF